MKHKNVILIITQMKVNHFYYHLILPVHNIAKINYFKLSKTNFRKRDDITIFSISKPNTLNNRNIGINKISINENNPYNQ